MKIVKDHENQQGLKESTTFPNNFLKYLEMEWNDLFEVLFEEEEKEKFSLEQHGE